ncbi:hypothetical protein CDD82_1878 [Ophiocordyceps australis]|uniref:Microbial-type PARG catalytic domain-containing protein n=1 Tax=Ophiocordyceps australis TaxID=1399860 RepID=A0A2C5ZJU2_9HYPO|nr:hypothetical protein CDD82_1878 [Ophiocordyceps australis]
MAPSSRTGRVKPSEVAAETKRYLIPMIREHYIRTHAHPPFSTLYDNPLSQLCIHRRIPGTRPPIFYFVADDPVSTALSYAAKDTWASQANGGPRIHVPFICAANERRPGGDWETGCAGYEEKLCRRSNLSAILSTPKPGSKLPTHYPIPLDGAVFSNSVVVGRGPHDRYDRLDTWMDLPVVSVAPIRWPKLRDNGMHYSFRPERDIMINKMRGALRICLYHNYDRVVIGDFGLGNSCRNPPREMAEMWRDILLFDPDIRGQFVYVIFAFEEPSQSTSRLIHDEIVKRERQGSSRSMPHDTPLAPSSTATRFPTDMSIFQQVFNPLEIERVLTAPDPRYGLNMITS